ncbi:MAG: ABC transporter [Methylothermaceae bacteria B42]|nr:MAG: ABC transporter [Methylothermaceae bacteria B42]HHJ38358.1 ABC transporter permease [Methylothermaceae bacterium]
MLASLGRIHALVVRYLYLLKGSWPRLLELAYWPTVQMILWGLINRFLAGQSEWLAQAAGLFIAAVLLWDVLFRAQLGVSVVFLEEMWSRNLGQLFVTPLRPWEWVLALMAISLLRTLIGVGAAALLAIALYEYSIFDMGLPLLAFFINLLVMGWAIGLVVISLVLRYGLGAEGLAWALIFALAPVSGIYYPVSVLPAWIQPIALALPSAHVFEGMRGLMIQHEFIWNHFYWAVGLNGLYLLLGGLVFLWSFHVARQRNLLLQLGE